MVRARAKVFPFCLYNFILSLNKGFSDLKLTTFRVLPSAMDTDFLKDIVPDLSAMDYVD